MGILLRPPIVLPHPGVDGEDAPEHNALTAQYNFAQGHRVDGEHGDGEDQEEDPALQLLLRPHRLCHLHRRLLDLCRRQYLLVESNI